MNVHDLIQGGMIGWPLMILALIAMPYRIVCNATEQKYPKARSGVALTFSRFKPLHNNRDGILIAIYLVFFRDTDKPHKEKHPHR